MTKSEILARITTRNEQGTHFTQIFSADDLSALEADGLISITRPTHGTGIPYAQDHWTVEVTDAGIEYLDANPEYQYLAVALAAWAQIERALAKAGL